MSAPSQIAVPLDKKGHLEAMEAELLKHPQVEAPLTHHFAPGVYMREVFMPAGCIFIGHEHTTEHFNIVLSGAGKVVIDGQTSRIVAPCVFSSGVGVRKAIIIEEDMRWLTVHPTDETDIEKLEAKLIRKSDYFNEFARLSNPLTKEIK
jgi:quercetin dioxygenase-like cupin family protein